MASARSFISTRMSTARSSSDSAGASRSGATGIGGAPASSRTRFTPSSGPRTSRTSPWATVSLGPGSNSHRLSERIAMTHMPVSVGSDSSRSVWPPASASSRTRTRAVISSAWRRSWRNASGMPRRAAITRATSDAAAPIRWIASAIHRHAGHPLRVLGAAGGEHRHRAESSQVPGRCAASSRIDLVGQLLLVEEDGGVGQVDHQLRGVLQLDEQVFDGIRRSVIHVAALPMMS